MRFGLGGERRIGPGGTWLERYVECTIMGWVCGLVALVGAAALRQDVEEYLWLVLFLAILLFVRKRHDWTAWSIVAAVGAAGVLGFLDAVWSVFPSGQLRAVCVQNNVSMLLSLSSISGLMLGPVVLYLLVRKRSSRPMPGVFVVSVAVAATVLSVVTDPALPTPDGRILVLQTPLAAAIVASAKWPLGYARYRRLLPPLTVIGLGLLYILFGFDSSVPLLSWGFWGSLPGNSGKLIFGILAVLWLFVIWRHRRDIGGCGVVSVLLLPPCFFYIVAIFVSTLADAGISHG